jgi:hypothetical protein
LGGVEVAICGDGVVEGAEQCDGEGSCGEDMVCADDCSTCLVPLGGLAGPVNPSGDSSGGEPRTDGVEGEAYTPPRTDGVEGEAYEGGLSYGSDPNAEDGGDIIADGDEVHTYGTDPNDGGDGIADGVECQPPDVVIDGQCVECVFWWCIES